MPLDASAGTFFGVLKKQVINQKINGRKITWPEYKMFLSEIEPIKDDLYVVGRIIRKYKIPKGEFMLTRPLNGVKTDNPDLTELLEDKEEYNEISERICIRLRQYASEAADKTPLLSFLYALDNLYFDQTAAQ